MTSYRKRHKHKRIKRIIIFTTAVIAFRCFAQEATAPAFDVLTTRETVVEDGGAVFAGLSPLQPERL